MHLTCSRIVSLARALTEAHRFGVPEGPHEKLWGPQYHAEAVCVYGESLPQSYQRAIASLFHHSADTMDEQMIPAQLAEDWAIVTCYLRNASAAIMDWLSYEAAEVPSSESSESPEMEDHPPVVVHFDHLAALASREGARRLGRAATAVLHHVDAPSSLVLDDVQRQLLSGVASGAAIADLAAELGYSRSSINRELSKLWKALGVPDRIQGVRKATAEGLL